MGFITAQGANNLASYKYSGVDQSILTKLFLNRFWNWLIEFVPRTIAPNVLTTIGLTTVLVGYLIMWNACPDMEGPPSAASLFWTGFCIFCYQTLDNLDGKQARRTGTSSALGEVFDHGGDSITVIAFAIITGSVLRWGPTLTFVTFLLLMGVFYMAHWEGYFTGVLVLKPLDNPTEAQFTLFGLMLTSILFGSDVWLREFGVPFVGSVQLNHIIFFLYVLGSVNTMLDNIGRVIEHQEGLQLSKMPPLLCIAPLLVIIVTSCLSVAMVPSLLLRSSRLLITTIGFFFAYIQIRLIVQHVSKDRFLPFYNILIALILFTFNCFLEWAGMPIVESNFLILIIFVAGFANWAYLGYSLIQEFCTILNIRAFSIPPPTLAVDRV